MRKIKDFISDSKKRILNYSQIPSTSHDILDGDDEDFPHENLMSNTSTAIANINSSSMYSHEDNTRSSTILPTNEEGNVEDDEDDEDDEEESYPITNCNRKRRNTNPSDIKGGITGISDSIKKRRKTMEKSLQKMIELMDERASRFATKSNESIKKSFEMRKQRILRLDGFNDTNDQDPRSLNVEITETANKLVSLLRRRRKFSGFTENSNAIGFSYIVDPRTRREDIFFASGMNQFDPLIMQVLDAYLKPISYQQSISHLLLSAEEE